MKSVLKDYKFIQKYDSQQKGVFTIADLKNALNAPYKMTLYRKIRDLELDGVITRFAKGVYVTKNVDLSVLSQRLYPDSYISLGNILAKELVIGSVPQKKVYAVKTGKGRFFKSKIGEIRYFGISQQMFFGFYCKNNLRLANKEKAFLDTLYYYQKGTTFSFNIYHDINLELLDIKKINEYLAFYKNTKFVAFVKGFLIA